MQSFQPDPHCTTFFQRTADSITRAVAATQATEHGPIPFSAGREALT
jgi:hypothetical protein